MFAGETELAEALETNQIGTEDLREELVANREALYALVEVESARLAQERADWIGAFAASNMGNTAYTESSG
jgi:hypothetical protein